MFRTHIPCVGFLLSKHWYKYSLSRKLIADGFCVSSLPPECKRINFTTPYPPTTKLPV